MQIDETDAPTGSLIYPFSQAEAHYTDAFAAPLSGSVALEDYIAAFYTTPLFKAERLVLGLAGAKSTDAEAYALARAQRDCFAVWTVEERRPSEILLAERSGHTKSWLAIGEGQLWFGSVVVPGFRRGRLTVGPVFQSLMGAHKVYSRLLLRAAIRKLSKAT